MEPSEIKKLKGYYENEPELFQYDTFDFFALIKKCTLNDFFEIVLECKYIEICSFVAHYLNDHAYDYGDVTLATAVEKMARIKVSPHMATMLPYTNAEQGALMAANRRLLETRLSDYRKSRSSHPTDINF